MTTALVLSGTSFVGRVVCDHLRQEGIRVTATSRKRDSRTGLVYCDLTDHASLNALVEETRPDWIVQCAGATQSTDPQELFQLHVMGTLGLLSSAERHVPESTVILFGSAAEYGSPASHQFPISETCLPVPTGFYGASKLAQTHLAAVAASERNLRIITVRPFNIVGPGTPKHYLARVLADRLRKMRIEEAGPEFLVPHGQATRDFIDVRDVTAAVVGLLFNQIAVPGQMKLFNIATGVETSLLSMAAHLGQLAGEYRPVDGGKNESRTAVQRSCGDSSLVRAVIGWEPKYDWRRSLGDIWKETGSAAGDR